MKTSANGRKFIESFEGLALKTYNDGTGTLTIGYGHTSAAGPPAVQAGMVITAAQADAYLAADLAKVEQTVSKLLAVEVNQNQFDSLVSFEFNIGELNHSNVLTDVNAKRFGAVPGDMLLWDHAHVNGQLVVMEGLKRRREAEGQLFKTPVTATPIPPPKPPQPPPPAPVAKSSLPAPVSWIAALLASIGALERGK